MIALFKKKQDCCGCTACKSICNKQAIKMCLDGEGFLYPHIDEALCVRCGMCKSVCPFQGDMVIERLVNQDGQPEPLVFALKHKSDNVRMSSTSGGAYTAISDHILFTTGEGILYGAEFNKEDNFIVRHKGATTASGRDSFRGSKYVQSNLEDVFTEIKQDLMDGKTVLFTGTPCQTAGLYKFLEKVSSTPKNITDNLILIDLVCHGSPSPLLWEQYVKFIQTKNKSKLQHYTFRSKERGWHGYNVKAVFDSGRCKVNTADIMIYTKLFCSDLALRPSCYHCKFSNIERPSDITIADFWGIEKSLPEFEDNKGVSLMLINTDKGQAVFEQIKNNVHYEQSSIFNCLQHNLKQPTELPPNREQFWQEYYLNGFNYIAKKYAGYNATTRMKSCTKKILNQLGLLSVAKKLLRQ